MKNTLRILSLLLAVLLLTACGATAAPSSTEGTEPIVTTTAAPTEPQPATIKNIIIIIGDGMGDAQIEVGELGMDKTFVFRDWQRTHSNTNSLDASGRATKVTDSAAGGTALATGVVTINKYIGKDAEGNDVPTILDHAKEYGKATGVVTTDAMNGATPASFSGHAMDRNDTLTILNTQLVSDVDLLCANATSEAKAMESFAKQAGYSYCDNFNSIGETKESEKAYWLFDMAGTGATNKLETVVPHALEFLDRDEDGFVLMIEQAHIDKYCHNNEIDGTLLMSNSLNNTVEAILQWLGDRNDTAIIITADHETGSLKVSPEKKYPNHFVATGDGFYYLYGSGDHSDTPVSVYVYGFTADFTPYYMDDTQEVIKNSSVFELMLDLLKNPERMN